MIISIIANIANGGTQHHLFGINGSGLVSCDTLKDFAVYCKVHLMSVQFQSPLP